MLNLVSKIIITQQANKTYPDRKNVYTLDFVNDVEIVSTWKKLTTTAKLILPKKVFVQTLDGLVSWDEKYLYASVDTTIAPIIMRGDRININLGYYYDAGNGYQTTMNEEFNGYITKINPKMPMEIECEDNMWLLKQAQCPNMVFPSNTNSATYKNGKGATVSVTSFDKKNWDVQSIVTCLLANAFVADLAIPNPFISKTLLPQLSKIKVINGVALSENISTNVGNFRTQNETICMILMRLRKDYKLDCFFRKDLSKTDDSWNDLYCSGVVYYPKDFLNSAGQIMSTQYDFQQNIIDSNNLIYLRKDDVRLGIKAFSVGKYELTTTNSAGNLSTKNKRLEVTVGDTDGDVRTQYFFPKDNKSPDLDMAHLKIVAEQRLNKLKYEGWRGSFMSFGLPYVQHGQAATLNDSKIPERTGAYLIQGTKVKFGVGGFRREIQPHIRIDQYNGGLKIADLINGL